MKIIKYTDYNKKTNESLSYPNTKYKNISNADLDGYSQEELNKILVCNNDGQGDTHAYTYIDMFNILSESDLPNGLNVDNMKPSQIFDEFCKEFNGNMTEYVYFDTSEGCYKQIKWE